mmetsp:Transcript_3547/g.6009  ORF Transcript_3547/g.6009 Transcript_3547/m.6009 type:complete len:254 (+) Transcript_3547:150-911(+)|eukprot:CAMPEP_0198210912 /NCGR_PEP_ID=MMETSP1445-20131203/22515_1 /TAXON_ID=36898 /ORGANISM="Pyramimonas sp., Strain CCMP2087" /LENGTH=253 /DNA_ID=CAMNT_0043885079 /DNA_START=133 /DNA_END=894 /DNA_ORIENTATION=-
MVSLVPMKIASVFLRLFYVAWVTVMLIWISLDGLNWFDAEKKDDKSVISFNLHPLMMSLGVLVLMSEAVISYRVYEAVHGFSHMSAKRIHSGLQLSAMIFMAVGLTIVFKNHKEKAIPHLYTAHSWIGVGVTSLMALQALGGVLAFFVNTNSNLKTLMLPVHRYTGIATYMLAVAAILMGLQEKSTFLKGSPQCASNAYCSQIIFANVLSVLAVLIAALTTSMLAADVKPLERTNSQETPLLASESTAHHQTI